jgi:hypothetical protein
MKKTPVNVVKERFESKEKLVAAVEKLATSELWLDRVNDKKGLARVSNAKLLRLHDALDEATKQFGTRAKLIDALLELDKRNKDAGFRTRLENYPVPRLLDLHRNATRTSRRAAAAESGAATGKKPAAPASAEAKAPKGAAGKATKSAGAKGGAGSSKKKSSARA